MILIKLKNIDENMARLIPEENEIEKYMNIWSEFIDSYPDCDEFSCTNCPLNNSANNRCILCEVSDRLKTIIDLLREGKK